MRLEGRTAVITGGGSGLARAVALRFAEEGANVVVGDIQKDPIGGGQPTADMITEQGGSAMFVQTDVSRWDDVDNVVSTAVDSYGRLDVMVNAAAVFEATNILDTTEEMFDVLMNVNVRGVFLCCKRVIAEMIDQPEINEVRGKVINFSSQHGMIGPPDFFAYAVSKGAIINMTHQLAVDYGRHGIMVNAIAPGRILTGTHGDVEDDDHPSVAESFKRTPFRRLGRPADIAGAALYLASDDASYVSGINLLVDGGHMAY